MGSVSALVWYDDGAEYSGDSTHTMPPTPDRLYSGLGVVAFRGTDGMDENWRPVVGMESSHEVSDLGRVRSLERLDSLGRRQRARVLTNARMTGRYLRIRLRDRDVRFERSLHVMVLEAFVGPRPVDHEGCHNNGDSRDNRLVNLRWDTRSANILDKRAHGTMVRGTRQHASRLDEASAALVRTLCAAGVGSDFLSVSFGVSSRTIDAIRHGETWSWVTPAVVPNDVPGRVVAVCRERKAARTAMAQARPGTRIRRVTPAERADRLVRAEDGYEAAVEEVRAIALGIAWMEGAR